MSKVNYVEAGFPNWTAALAAGEGEARLSRQGLRALPEKNNQTFDDWIGMRGSPLPSSSGFGVWVPRARSLGTSRRMSCLRVGVYARCWPVGRGLCVNLEFECAIGLCDISRYAAYNVHLQDVLRARLDGKPHAKINRISFADRFFLANDAPIAILHATGVGAATP
ncbi:hypothetical protein [uncultured Tateyamaria sp.]|uniref:hypothetical protein n=1 Tax=uncultured Tateyamaria sp. TaxID=455651 RepID=UPI00260DB3A7|nr:hypothetical protein [uncultured Tateyamaria sp.]